MPKPTNGNGLRITLAVGALFAGVVFGLCWYAVERADYAQAQVAMVETTAARHAEQIATLDERTDGIQTDVRDTRDAVAELRSDVRLIMDRLGVERNQ